MLLTPVVHLQTEYLREFLKKFEMTLMGYTGAWQKLIHEINLKPKISWYYLFKCLQIRALA
jgi:hypothetical protein